MAPPVSAVASALVRPPWTGVDGVPGARVGVVSASGAPGPGEEIDRMALNTIAVVGASLAGLRAIETLRLTASTAASSLVGAEPPSRTTGRRSRRTSSRASRSPTTSRSRRSRRTTTSTSTCRLGARADAPRSRRPRASPSTTANSVAFDGLRDRYRPAPRMLPDTPDLHGHFVLRTLEDALAIRGDARRAPARSSSSEQGSSAPRSRPRVEGAASRSRCSKRCPRRWCAGSARARHGVR